MPSSPACACSPSAIWWRRTTACTPRSRRRCLCCDTTRDRSLIWRNLARDCAQPLAELRFADLPIRQPQEGPDPVLARGFQTPAVQLQKGQRRDQGDPFVAVDEAVIPRQPIGVAGGEVEFAHLLGVGEQVSRTRQGGVQRTAIADARGPAVL